MKTIKKIQITPVFCEDDIPANPSDYQQNTVYISKAIDKIGMNCICGCPGLVIIPVNKTPEGWQLTVNDGKITLIGSIANQPCGAHYVITDNIATLLGE